MDALRITTLLAALLITPFFAPIAHAASAPAGAASDRSEGLHLTIFRSPASGLEWRAGAWALHAGHYPTILRTDGQNEGQNTNFIRAGATYYARQSSVSPYFSPSLVLSLDDDWQSGALTEAGLRMRLARTLALRVGAGVLTTFDGEVRLNPTIGLDVALPGAGR